MSVKNWFSRARNQVLNSRDKKDNTLLMLCPSVSLPYFEFQAISKTFNKNFKMSVKIDFPAHEIQFCLTEFVKKSA